MINNNKNNNFKKLLVVGALAGCLGIGIAGGYHTASATSMPEEKPAIAETAQSAQSQPQTKQPRQPRQPRLTDYDGSYIDKLPPELQEAESQAIEKALREQSTYGKGYILEYREKRWQDIGIWNNADSGEFVIYDEPVKTAAGGRYSEGSPKTVEDFTRLQLVSYVDAADPNNKFGKFEPDYVVPKEVIDRFVAQGLSRDEVVQAISRTGRTIEK